MTGGASVPPVERLRVAFYGSLRRGFGAQELLGINARLRPLGTGRIAGTLVDCGEYPALVDGPGWVAAEFYSAEDRTVIATLDAYEDCHPARPDQSLYRREWRPVEGPVSHAWVYVYNRDPAGLPVIPGGDWARHRPDPGLPGISPR